MEDFMTVLAVEAIRGVNGSGKVEAKIRYFLSSYAGDPQMLAQAILDRSLVVAKQIRQLLETEIGISKDTSPHSGLLRLAYQNTSHQVAEADNHLGSTPWLQTYIILISLMVNFPKVVFHGSVSPSLRMDNFTEGIATLRSLLTSSRSKTGNLHFNRKLKNIR